MPRMISRRAGLTPPSPEDIARRRADNIRSAITEAAEDYAQAVIEEDWKHLGYESVEAWREGEFGALRLIANTRREVVELLAGSGKTVREIEAATGASHQTVLRDRKLVVPSGTTSGSPRQQAAQQREADKRLSLSQPKPSPPETKTPSGTVIKLSASLWAASLAIRDLADPPDDEEFIRNLKTLRTEITRALRRWEGYIHDRAINGKRL